MFRSGHGRNLCCRSKRFFAYHQDQTSGPLALAIIKTMWAYSLRCPSATLAFCVAITAAQICI